MRKRRLLSVVIAAVTLTAGACTRDKGEALPGARLDYEERTLSNGLRVILIPNGTAPVVSYQTWVRVGSVDEKPGYTGMAHMYEHLMFKGTAKYPEKEFFKRLEAKGAEVNAYTARDYTVYYENFTPNLLDTVIDMEADRLAHFRVTDPVYQTERMVVLEERRLRVDNSPAGKMTEALWRLAYKRHPYQSPVIGEPEDLIQRIKTEDLLEFFRKYYQPGNVVLVVTGAIDSEEVFAKIKKAYSGIKGRKQPKREIPAEPEQTGEERYVMRDHVASERFLQGYHCSSAVEQDSYALDVLSNVLFEGSSSRMNRRLVEEERIALGVSGSAYTPTFPGLFVISVTMKGGVPAAKGEASVEKLMDEAKAQGISADELQAAVKQLTVDMLDGIRTPFGLGELFGTVSMVLGDVSQAREDLRKYERVTLEDVKRVANKYFFPNNRTVVTLKPEAADVGKKAQKAASR